MKKLLAALLFTLPTLAFAIDLEDYYITPKGGASKTFNTGMTSFNDKDGNLIAFPNEDLDTGSALGFSVGKYVTDSFRLELEAIKRTNYEYDVNALLFPASANKAKIETHALFINGFYDFQTFSISNTPITPYLGGGVGISRNKMGTIVEHEDGPPNGMTTDGDTINQFAYKLSAGILFSLTEQLSLDVNYQYVNLGAFKGSTEVYDEEEREEEDYQRGTNGGEIKSQELIVGLQYTF